MTDILSRKARSMRMSLIRSTNTKPELYVRSLTHSLGYRFRLHRNNLPGKPDLVFPRRKAVIFVHGCFWHQHVSRTCRPRRPKSRKKYWHEKLARNAERDKVTAKLLRKTGWRVLIIWECQIKRQPENLPHRIKRFLES